MPQILVLRTDDRALQSVSPLTRSAPISADSILHINYNSQVNKYTTPYKFSAEPIYPHLYLGAHRDPRSMLCLRTGTRLSSLARNARMMSTILPLQPPSLDEESALLESRTKDMEAFFTQPRFAGIKRPYSPASVATKQGSLPVLPLPSSLLAEKLFSLFTKAAASSQPVHTMGAIDPVQVTQMARHQEVVYVSGWAASSVLTTGNNEVGPDLG